MSCWQRADWGQFFDCAYGHLTEPVYIWFPFGLTYLVAIALGAGLGWLLVRIAYRIFGDAIFVPFDLLADAVTFPLRWYRRQRAAAGDTRQPEVGQAGGTPAGGQERERGMPGRLAFLLRRRSREAGD